MESLSDNHWLVVGLGNPGNAYANTRHNLGFMLIDLLARQVGFQIKREECGSLIGLTEIGGKTVEFVKPLTFMNLSGEAVSCLLKKPDRSLAKLLVISDDLALPLGKIRLRSKGSHGGHNGLRSIIDCLGTSDFIRLRIGILPEHPVDDTRNFVLRNFAKGEVEIVENVLGKSAEAVRAIITDGIDTAMAAWNAEDGSRHSDREVQE